MKTATANTTALDDLALLELKLAVLDGEPWAIKQVLEDKQYRDLVNELLGGGSMSENLSNISVN